MIVIGLDIATTTGFALYDTERDPSTIKAWSTKLKGESSEENAGLLAIELVKVIREHKPRMFMIETPLKMVTSFAKKPKANLFGGGDGAEEKTINPAAVIVPNQLTGAAIGIIFAYQLGWQMISSAAWRKQFLGYGRQKGWQRADWKKAARERCNMIGVKVTNDDQGDAVGVAFSAPASQTFRLIEAGA